MAVIMRPPTRTRVAAAARRLVSHSGPQLAGPQLAGPLTLHHVPHTRGFRIIWLCAELGVPCELARVDFSAEYRASPEWRNMNPVGKVPVLIDRDIKLFESGAIVQHILDRYGSGRLQPPRASAEHARYMQWSWFAEATFSRATGELANHKRAFNGALIAPVMEEMKVRARSCLLALNDEIAGRPYLLSEFSAADIMMGYALQSFERNVGEDLPSHAQAYFERLKTRPAFEAAARANLMEDV